MINNFIIESAFAEFGNQASSKVITFKRYLVGLTLLLWSCGMVVYRKGVTLVGLICGAVYDAARSGSNFRVCVEFIL